MTSLLFHNHNRSHFFFSSLSLLSFVAFSFLRKGSSCSSSFLFPRSFGCCFRCSCCFLCISFFCSRCCCFLKSLGWNCWGFAWPLLSGLALKESFWGKFFNGCYYWKLGSLNTLSSCAHGSRYYNMLNLSNKGFICCCVSRINVALLCISRWRRLLLLLLGLALLLLLRNDHVCLWSWLCSISSIEFLTLNKKY